MGKDGSYIWNQLKLGTKQSFESLFKACYPQLCLFSKQYTKDMDIAREVVQDLFVYLWGNREKLRDIDSVKPYVYSAVKFNSIRRYNNKSQKTIDISDIHEEQFAADFHDQIEYAELQHAISQTIENLPPQCRRIFKMSRFEKLTYKEIANSLGISQKTVEAQISKALRNIQKTLRKYLITIILLLCCIC
jgi:RNA polymerase sigma-70 factor, ECF subfamily